MVGVEDGPVVAGRAVIYYYLYCFGNWNASEKRGDIIGTVSRDRDSLHMIYETEHCWVMLSMLALISRFTMEDTCQLLTLHQLYLLLIYNFNHPAVYHHVDASCG